MRELFSDYPVFLSEGSANEDNDAQTIIYDVRMSNAGPIEDINGNTYQFVGKFLNDNDFYQGLNMVSVIRNVQTGRLYGYAWWDGMECNEDSCDSNGDQFGLECDTSADDFDWDTWYAYYVFEPVEEYPIKAYKFTED